MLSIPAYGSNPVFDGVPAVMIVAPCDNIFEKKCRASGEIKTPNMMRL